jgi:UDP-N-acetylmuramoyl-L-alanyl-D-glutamate--2,6-diaminopimelate ligase
MTAPALERDLAGLLAGVEVLDWKGARQVPVTGLTYDARQVRPGDAFCTWRGLKSDGHAHVDDALQRGARALVVERAIAPELGEGRACVRVPSGRRALSLMAAEFFHRPADRLSLAGVTGTNGKTTTVTLLHYLLTCAGHSCGLLGTVEYRLGNRVIEAARTTPEGMEIQQYLAEMVGAGCTHAAMEVSSHALELDRVAGIAYHSAIFTNLTRDHLDFHGDMEAYFRAKRRLFEGLQPGASAVVRADDPYASRIFEALRPGVVPYSYGLGAPADYRAERVGQSLQGTSFEWITPGGRWNVRTPLVGTFQVENILAALCGGVALGLSADAMVGWMRQAPSVPGRMQRAGSGELPFAVLVDYAHTDDALRRVLAALRPLVGGGGKLRVLAGCGGDRDRTKRPLMAAAACELGDEVVFTSDNPRTESQDRIFADMLTGVPSATNYQVIPERGEAIRHLVGRARSGDILLLAGKGHERIQDINGVKHPFSDVAAAEEALAGRSV